MPSTLLARIAGFLAIFYLLVQPAAAVNVTTAEFNAFLSVPQVLKLGSPSQDYIGALILRRSSVNSLGNAQGTGIAIISGAVTNFSGSWVIRNNQFCRKWNAFKSGNEVCETWAYLTWNSVRVVADGAQIGVNSW